MELFEATKCFKSVSSSHQFNIDDNFSKAHDCANLKGLFLLPSFPPSFLFVYFLSALVLLFLEFLSK